MRLLLVLPVCFVVLCGCVGGGNYSLSGGTLLGRTLITDYWPNGNLKARGYVGVNAQGAVVRTDAWQLWFDNGQKEWEGSYLNGVIDDTRSWQEWNRNGSLRDTSTDH